MAYSYKNKKGQNYILHRQEVKLKGSGKLQTIYFFSKNTREGALDDLPDGFEVVENSKTGLPVLRKNH